MMKERDILALLLTKGLGPKGVSRILSTVAFHNGQIDLSLMSAAEMIQRIGIKPETADQIPESIKKADEVLNDLEAQGVKILVRRRAGYPERLLKTLKEDAPLVLFAKGNIKILQQKAVGFCGSRKASEKGLAVAGECAGALAKRHINVISGYAHGVDLAAHRAVLEAGGVTTFVLAEGILHFKIKGDVKDLLIEDNYVVVSEYMPRLPWLARNAMQRNKTICGLSNAVVVIESGMQGGTFEAGKTALELKRPLFVAEYAQPAMSAEGNTFFLQKGARFLRKKNGVAYLEELFSAVEQDENDGIPPDTDHPASQYRGEMSEADVQQPLSVWEPEKSYGEQGKVYTGDKKRVVYPKRLIEVDLPIKKISEHARREKSIRHGHISTLHLWWARRPLAACRAVICAALWPDPGDPNCPENFKSEAARLMKAFRDKRGGKNYEWNDGVELRKSLLEFIADFANWDNSTNKDYLETSRSLTQVAHESLGGEPGTRPLVVDPFAGGGSIPLEALRVGADAFASDLNPVAVLLNKVVLEYIPKYGQKLADEVRKWGTWIKKEAEKELAEFYPKDPDGATPIAYLWARTIQCEGPSCGAEVPLMRSLWLAKKGSKSVALKIIPDAKNKRLDFEIIENVKEKDVDEGTVRRGSATCPVCGFTTPVTSVRQQLKISRGGADNARLIAVVVTRSGQQGRFYRLPTAYDLEAVLKATKELNNRKRLHTSTLSLVPDEPLPPQGTLGFRVQLYGMRTWGNLFAPRQALALTTFSRLVRETGKKMAAEQDAEFVNAVQVCLSFAVDKLADLGNSLSRWEPVAQCPRNLFGRQAIPIMWDFSEGVPTGDSSGAFGILIDGICQALHRVGSDWKVGQSTTANATKHPLPDDSATMFVTDPPYYDMVPFSDLSDFFYVWLKRSIGANYSMLFCDEVTPKKDECVVDVVSGRGHDHFENSMRMAMEEGRRLLQPTGIGVVFFAHKSTAGWEAQLQAMVDAGWKITASWPISTENTSRLRAQDSAALASSIQLVCRPRENPDGSLNSDEIGDWRNVLAELPKRIHEWMPRLAEEGVVGADAIFACLGPALEIFSRYSRVEKASGEVVTLKEYLEHVWAAVAKEALNMIFEGAETTGFEEDARLTAMWLWTLSRGNGSENPPSSPIAKGGEIEEDEDEEEKSSSKVKLSGYTLEYDAARKIAQGLGAHLERLQSLVEIKGDKARLLPVAERTRALFGKDEATTPKAKKKKKEQLSMFAEIEEAEESGTWGTKNVPQLGNTTLDRLHQSMILFAAGRGEALKRFLVEEGVGKDARFWRLAQAFSALYPKNTDEKRWVDGVLARKKGLGL